MDHLKAIVIKFVATFALLYVILGIGYDFSLMSIFWFTVTLGAISYLLGDLLILRRTNNTVASISDFILAYVVLYFMMDAAVIRGDINLFTAALISAVGITVFEYFFHKYVERRINREDMNERTRRYEYQTEFSEEFDPDDFDDR